MFGIFERENSQWVEKLKQERERKLTKIRNKWLEQVKYTGILEEDDFSEISKPTGDNKSGVAGGTSPAKQKKGG